MPLVSINSKQLNVPALKHTQILSVKCERDVYTSFKSFVDGAFDYDPADLLTLLAIAKKIGYSDLEVRVKRCIEDEAKSVGWEERLHE